MHRRMRPVELLATHWNHASAPKSEISQASQEGGRLLSNDIWLHVIHDFEHFSLFQLAMPKLSHGTQNVVKNGNEFGGTDVHARVRRRHVPPLVCGNAAETGAKEFGGT